MRWYFAHTHDRVPGGRRLADYLQRMTGCTLVNPFDLEKDLTRPMDIVLGDLDLIGQCHGTLAWFVRDTCHIGTSMEVFYTAQVMKNPVVVYCFPERRDHPWLRAMTDVYTQVGDVIDALRRHREQWERSA